MYAASKHMDIAVNPKGFSYFWQNLDEHLLLTINKLMSLCWIIHIIMKRVECNTKTKRPLVCRQLVMTHSYNLLWQSPPLSKVIMFRAKEEVAIETQPQKTWTFTTRDNCSWSVRKHWSIFILLITFSWPHHLHSVWVAVKNIRCKTFAN